MIVALPSGLFSYISYSSYISILLTFGGLVSDGRRQTVNVCGRNSSWIFLVLGFFLCSDFRIPLNSLSSFIKVSVMYVFHCDVSQMRQTTYANRTYFIIWGCINIKGEVFPILKLV